MIRTRVLSPEEVVPLALPLWTEVFGVEAAFFTSLLDGLAPGEGRSYAALEDGRVVASVHVFDRLIRDREGRGRKVGGIGSVSTRPESRGRGLSRSLLEMALDGMTESGCEWSLLGTGVNDHYARHGWRTVSTPVLGGKLRDGLAGEARLLNPDEETLSEMARLYDASTAERPLATVRSALAWRTAVRYRLDPKRARIFGAFEGDRLAAYLVARDSGERRQLAEAAGDPGRFPALLAGAGALLREEGVRTLASALPDADGLREAFAGIVEAVRVGEGRHMMLRPIAGRTSWPELAALWADERGRHSPLDDF